MKRDLPLLVFKPLSERARDDILGVLKRFLSLKLIKSLDIGIDLDRREYGNCRLT